MSCYKEVPDGECIVHHYTNGDKQWWRKGLLHRENGPAVEWFEGDARWYCNGLLHRPDGPAVDYINRKEWWINGKFISRTEKGFLTYLRLEKLKAFW